MKKQYVKGYASDNKSRDKLGVVLLVGICSITLVATLIVAGIMTPSIEEDKLPAVATEEAPLVVESSAIEEAKPQNPLPEPTPPVFVAPCRGDILLEYSEDMPVYSETLDDWRIHEGVDIAAPLEAEVRAMTDGIISDKYDDLRHGYTVVVDHEGGLRSIYSNLSEMDTAVIGTRVKAGDVISHVGDTTLFETIADTHLHLEVLKDGEHVNPLDYFLPEK